MTRFLAIISFFLTINTFSQESVSSRFCDCVNENIYKNSPNSKFDFFELMRKAESLIIEYKILKESNKSSYYNFLNQKKSKKKYPELDSALTKIIQDKNIQLTVGIDMVVFGKCHKKFKNEDLEVPFYEIGKNINTIWINGFYEARSLKKLFEMIPEENFKEIYIRAPIIYMTVIRILEDY